MSVLLDTGVLYGALNNRDTHHRAAQNIIRACASGRLGRVLTTNFAVDEACSLIQRRWLAPRILEDLARLVGLEPGVRPLVEILCLGQADLLETFTQFQRHYTRGLSFTDCSHLAVMERHGIENLATFDRGFDGLTSIVAG